VHFAIAASAEQEASVQEAAMAAEAMHDVAIVQAVVWDGSQQPWMPKKVFVAHVSVGFGQVTALTTKRLAYIED
jgi:hypothetical protein